MPGKNYTQISNLVCTKMKTSSNPFFSRNFLKHLAAGVLCALLASSCTSQQHVCSLSVEPTCRHMVHRVAKRGRSAFLDWGGLSLGFHKSWHREKDSLGVVSRDDGVKGFMGRWFSEGSAGSSVTAMEEETPGRKECPVKVAETVLPWNLGTW